MKQSAQRPRHGGNVSWAARVAGCFPEELLDFSASINPLGPPASVMAAIQSTMQGLKHYPDPECCQLTQCLSQIHGLPPSWFLPGNGVAELLTWVGRELAQLDQVRLLSPGFGDYRRALSAFDASVQRFAVDLSVGEIASDADADAEVRLEPDRGCDSTIGLKGGWSLSTRDDFMTGLGAQVGCILNDPHNPTGQRLDPAWVQECLHRFAWVVIDEAFIDFLPPDQQSSWIPYLAQFPNLVILRSLTKFYSIPGLRIGYAIAHPGHIARWKQWRDPWSVNVLALAAAEAALNDATFQHQTWKWLVEARTQLFAGLAAFPSLRPRRSCANFLLVHYRGNVPELQLKLLRQSRILIRDCLSFERLGEQYFRVAVLQIPENQRLLSALDQALS